MRVCFRDESANVFTYILVRYLRLFKCDRGIDIKRINRKRGRMKPLSSSLPSTITITRVRYVTPFKSYLISSRNIFEINYLDFLPWYNPM